MSTLKTVIYDQSGDMVQQRELKPQFKELALNHYRKSVGGFEQNRVTQLLRNRREQFAGFKSSDILDKNSHNSIEFHKFNSELASFGFTFELLDDYHLNVIAQRVANAKCESLVNMFCYYKMESIISMAESNHNEVSQLFIELEFNVKLPKTMRDRKPLLKVLSK